MNSRLSYQAAVFSIGLSVLLAAFSIAATSALAGSYPWRDHEKPFDFRFGNHFDTHQQTRVLKNGDLFGFLYITYIPGETIGGIPVAAHCDGATPAEACQVGWMIRGKWIGDDRQPMFVYHNDDHPIWLVQSRSDIPQPGSFSHFHWLGPPDAAGDLVPGVAYDGYMLELKAVETFYFRHSGEDVLVRPGIDTSTHVNLAGSFPFF